MNDVHRWIYLDGPAPAFVRELLGAANDIEPESPEDDDRLVRAVLARIDAAEGRAPAVTPPPKGLASTAMAPDHPPEVWKELGRLPFASPDAVPPEKRAAATLELPVMRPDHRETTPLGDDRISKAVAAMPFTASKAGPALVSFPRMPWQRYIGLCAELRVRPDAWATILQRYEVPTTASLQALHEAWQAHFAAHPEEHAAAATAFWYHVQHLSFAPR